jgi:uncharacterized membrane protein
MSTHTARPAIDLAPTKQARPGLALALAILAVPGVTIAWDLPHGGFYTGVPLAVAAIVTGLQARARLSGGKGRIMAAIAVAIAALALLSVALITAIG